MLAVVLIGAYLLGAVPFAVLVGRGLRGIDVRRAGTGNTGTLNTVRTAGPLAGLIVASLDIGKAALAVIIGGALLGPEAGALAGCAAVIGHCFSPYLLYSSRHEAGGGWKMALRRAGGKGLACGVGVLFLIAWPAALLGIAVFAVIFAVQRKNATLPSVLGTCVAALATWLWTGNTVLGIAALVVAMTVVIKHMPDLREDFYVEALT